MEIFLRQNILLRILFTMLIGSSATVTAQDNDLLCHMLGDIVTCFLKLGINVARLNTSGLSTGEFSNVSQLYLTDNSIEIIERSTFAELFSLTEIILTNNKINRIEDFSFHDQSQLMDLRLRENRIEQLNKNTFFGLSSLMKLDLGVNQISGKLELGTFQFLPQLHELHLSFNNITELDDCVFCNITSLTLLYFNNNLIRTIHRNAFKGLHQIEVLDLSNNMIMIFDFTTIKYFSVLRRFVVDHNNWTCSCDLYQFYNTMLAEANVSVSCGVIGNLCVLCSSPASLHGASLYNLTEANITDCANDMTTTIEGMTTTSLEITHMSNMTMTSQPITLVGQKVTDTTVKSDARQLRNMHSIFLYVYLVNAIFIMVYYT